MPARSTDNPAPGEGALAEQSQSQNRTPPAGLLAGGLLAQNSRLGSAPKNAPLHQAIALSKPLTASGLRHPLYDFRVGPRCSGKERDAETGLDYFGARYFSAAQGRWTIPDWSVRAEAIPYARLDNPQSLNLYSYVLNNPLRYADPDGHTDPPTCGGSDHSTCVVTMTQVVQDVNFYNKQGKVVSTVEVTTDLSVVSNSETGAVVSVGATSTAANVSGQAFNKSQLATIGSTVGAVTQAGASMSLGANPPQLMTAILAKESALGIGAPVNPLQLSCSSGSCANADRQHNIQGALNVLQNLGKRSGYDPAITYGRYNGVPNLAQRTTNVNNFMRIYNGMSQSWWGFNPAEPPDPPLPPGLQ